MRLPLRNILRKQAHIELADLQDEVVDVLFNITPDAIFHGGTSIWRCYEGNRFSEDLDFYLKDTKNFEEKLNIELKKRGLELTKFRKADNSIYSKISNGKTEVSLELELRDFKDKFLTEYKKTDSSTISIYCLSKEDLLIEKAKAFLSRKLIRDYYDVYFLSKDINLEKFLLEIKDFSKSEIKPVDETNLKTLIYSGICPTFKEMQKAIASRGL